MYNFEVINYIFTHLETNVYIYPISLRGLNDDAVLFLTQVFHDGVIVLIQDFTSNNGGWGLQSAME